MLCRNETMVIGSDAIQGIIPKGHNVLIQTVTTRVMASRGLTIASRNEPD
ncbi:MAG: hypothetical protein AAB089_07140 [Nitrospirota bacterium]